MYHIHLVQLLVCVGNSEVPCKNSENSEFRILSSENETNDDESHIKRIGLTTDRNIPGNCL